MARKSTTNKKAAGRSAKKPARGAAKRTTKRVPKSTAATATAASDGGELLTMSEIQRRTGLSRPTLQKYKFEYADRIPSVGTGRTQRYPEEAVAVILAIREENRARVGRPSKKDRESAASTSKRGAKGKAAKVGTSRSSTKGKGGKRAAGSNQTSPEAPAKGLMTLTELARRVGVSLPTARRYVTDHLERIAHEGEGRGKRFYEEAVAALHRVKKEAAGRRGRRGKAKANVAGSGRQASAPTADVSRLVARLEALEARIIQLEKDLERPLRLEIRR